MVGISSGIEYPMVGFLSVASLSWYNGLLFCYCSKLPRYIKMVDQILLSSLIELSRSSVVNFVNISMIPIKDSSREALFKTALVFSHKTSMPFIYFKYLDFLFRIFTGFETLKSGLIIIKYKLFYTTGGLILHPGKEKFVKMLKKNITRVPELCCQSVKPYPMTIETEISDDNKTKSASTTHGHSAKFSARFVLYEITACYESNVFMFFYFFCIYNLL